MGEVKAIKLEDKKKSLPLLFRISMRCDALRQVQNHFFLPKIIIHTTGLLSMCAVQWVSVQFIHYLVQRNCQEGRCWYRGIYYE